MRLSSGIDNKKIVIGKQNKKKNSFGFFQSQLKHRMPVLINFPLKELKKENCIIIKDIFH